MQEFADAIPTFLIFVLLLLILAWLSHQISRYIQIVVYFLTRSEDMATVVLFLVFLPGTIIHEAAHWVAARLLGLKTGKFRVWPKRTGKYIRLGSVTVERGNLLIDSLVGAAPLIVGTFLIALISHRIFGAYLVTEQIARGQWIEGLGALSNALRQPDSGLWLYAIFAIGNAMMPSPSDTEPIKPLLLYLLLATAFYFLIGLPLAPVNSAAVWLLTPVQDLSSAFFFVILVDGLVLVGLYLLGALVAPSAP